MGLLAHHRRFWFVVAMAVLTLPMVTQIASPPEIVSLQEARPLAPKPAWPSAWAQWLALPRTFDKFLGDHFGGREALVRDNAVIRHALRSPSNVGVVYGRDGKLFFNGDGMLEQSLGLLRRDDQLAKFANFAATLANQYRAQNVKFLVAIPPNASTIERQLTPQWFSPKSETEYDVMLRMLADRGVPNIDLRVPLAAVNERQPVYLRADTHWNKLGALLAFNDVVAALEKPEWIIEPSRVFAGYVDIPGGDLARMLGAPNDIRDRDARIDLSSYRPQSFTTTAIDTHKAETGGNLTETGRDGPSVVVLGDSFTETAWRDYFALHTGKLGWIHHELCDFDPAVVAALKPDIVILAPTERFMFCWNRSD